VGVSVVRSVEMVVALLGVLKAGGAYVPLDPQYPQERIAHILEDARVKLVLTQTHLADRLPATEAEVVRLDGDAHKFAAESEANPRSGATADNLLYVIYTSGSTGRPKGIAMPHRPLVNLLTWVGRHHDLPEGARTLQFASLSFDVSFEDIFSTLLTGGTLVVVPDEVRNDLLALPRVLSEKEINRVILSPAALQQVAEAATRRESPLASLRRVVVSGEQLQITEAITKLFDGLEDATLRNEYGPAETHVVTALTLAQPAREWPPRPAIGRPVDNAEIFILDKNSQPTPVGVPGELYIGGDALARGYMGRPDLTAERFVPDPFSNAPGARVYRTGDLARWRADGQLEYLGRIDDQVKIRGFRVELGEIEAVLAQHPSVHEVVVMARSDQPGDLRLVAYVASGNLSAQLASELRNYSRERLPDYMIPSHFVLLDRLPLTPNGKVDRRALPAPDLSRASVAQEYEAPRTAVEELVAGLWSEVLGIKRVGVEDSFFDVGGHSLLATQLVSRLRDSFGVEIPLRRLFEAPTVRGIAAAIEDQLKGGAIEQPPPITRAPREEPLPLSFAQQRLWFLHQLEPDAAVYNIPVAVRLTGELNVAALEWTLGEIMRRHEALRTTFADNASGPVQVIADSVRPQLSVTDLRDLPEDEREREAQRLAEAEARRPFDLSRGPLVRASLLRLEDTKHALLFTMHHIVSDGWSMGVLIREVTALYAAYVAGQPSPLPELPVQYADFAVWQRQYLSGEVLDEQLSYWKQKLAGAPPVLELPTDRPRPAVHSLRGEKQIFNFQYELLEQLGDLSRREGVTLYMVLLAAFQTLLSRYSGQEDIVVGSPIAGRNRAETESLIGFFVNTLAMRTDLSGDPTFTELLGRVRETSLGAYAHQDVPFEKLVEELQPERDMSHAPIFQVALTLQNVPMEEASFGGLTLTHMAVEMGTAMFDFRIWLREWDEGLGGHIEYNTDLFDAATMRRLIEHFGRLLRAAAEDPSRRLSELPLVGEEERRKMLVDWNSTATDYPRDATIHRLFEQQVEQTPDATAVVFGDEQLTYAELNRRANKLAHYLRGLGVGPEVCVGLCVERSIEMVVGLLGILKAGGAYLPIDADYPLERITFMLEEAGVPVLLTQERLLDELPAHWAHVLCLDTEWQQVEGESEENPEAEADAENLAYVIYTSGSTGRPKGVGVVHRNVVRLVKENYFASFAPEEVFLQLASVSFDASTFEVWGSLLNGARLVVAPADALSLEELGRFVRERGVTTMWLTAGLFHQMADGHLADLRGLRQLLAGGDVLSVPHVGRALRELPGCRLINGYGPTESTTFACTHAIADEGELAATVPIGRPIANTTVYLLDARMEPVPVGVWGELYIGGDGLARGYLKRPRLTAERFIPDPFSTAPGARLYRTGDVARYLEDGRIEFQGRRDQQVKVRGFRIELGEIEAVLLQHRAVREAAVVARQGHEAGGDKLLAAYLVYDADAPVPNASELHRFVRERLPDYMIPSHFITLDALPLTPNGKVDRRALPAPDLSRPEQETDYVAPRNELEETLAGVWAEVLEVERVGVNDDFFELGGHSLLATQVISRVRGLFGVELPLRCMFESPTIAEMSVALAEELGARESEPQAATIERVARGGALPLSFSQQRLWFLDQFEPGLAVYNIPMAVRLRGRLDLPALEQTVNEIVRRHEALRTTFAVAGGEPTQVIAQSLSLPLPVVDLTELAEEARASEVERLSAEEAREPFDLSTGPLLRMKLLRLAETEHVLLFTIHHIVGDNWSLNVLVREVATLYEAFREGRPSPLAELPVQYADYAAWQREYLSGEVLEGQLDYWREQLREVPVLELPTDRPRPVVQTFEGTTELFRLEPSLAQSLHALGRREDVTLYMTLLAAFQVLLSRYSGQKDIVVGSAIANRNRAETESLIGFFVNTLAMRTDLSGDPTFTDLLGRVREVALGAYAHQDVPFEKLVEELQTERDMSHAPLFQVAFALQNAPGGRFDLPGLALEYVPTDSGTAHFDLTLLLTESDAGLWGYLEYNTALFDASTMRRFVKHFANLLEGIAADPARRLSELPLVGEDEQRQLLIGWNETASDYPRDKAIHQLFEQQVERAPDAVAVVFGDEQLTYAELNGRANRLAHFLRKSGVGPETRVGICVERSAEMVVGLLGILKAGGCYVPLDPTHPAPRLAFMIEDAAVPVLLTQERLADSLPQYDGQTVRLDADWDSIERESSENLDAATMGDHLAYIIYTSGTTGQPKGSSIPHRAVNRLVVNTDYVRLDATDRVAQVSNSSFDAATFEIWGALLNGAALVVFTKDLALSPQEFAAQLRGQRITTLFLTTALFNLLAAKAPEAFAGLRHLLFGGEAVDPGWVREVFENAPPQRLLHVYGPTESTTYSTWHLVETVAHGATTVPIGRAIANTEIYVLDEGMRPVPVGVPGELYIGGDGLARNYHQRPAQTAERFVPHPFASAPGERLYRTGDVVRWREGGHIEFLGRRDQQVKVRGFRIELGEIEAVLAQHPSVREVVVTAQGESAEKRLVAYVVGQTVTSPTAVAPGHMTAAAPARVSLVAELRSYVRERLPDYMMPSNFVTLDALPLTPNGKVDRRALPAPDMSGAEFEQDYVAPRTGIEELVAGVWSEILGLERVGVEDNFFELGGHSLLATQLASRLRESFGVEIPLRRLFETPTVRGVAAAVEEGLKGERGERVPPIERATREEPLPLSFAQQRLWFFEQLEPGTNAYNVPIALRLRGELDVAALERTLNEITRRHEALRTTFSVFEGEPVQIIADSLELPLPVTDLRHLPDAEREAEAERLIAEDAREPFDLTRGPLLRASLLRLEDAEHALLFTMHHIVSDGWSMGVLVREVATLYAAFVQNQPSPLPELSVQYADFAVWQREYLSGEVLEEQLAYWKQQLAGAPPVLELPTDRPRPAVRSLRGAVHSVELPENLTAELKALSQREGVTLYMTLLAAFQLLLARYSGQEDVVVGSPIANRNHAETEDLIGFFVNTLAMRADLSGDPTFVELLGRVRETSLGAYAHQDVPFEKLVEELQPERDMSHAPIFQVVLALQNSPGGRLELPGLALEYMPTDIGTIRFDLTLLMNEAEDGLAGVLRYNPDLFDASTIERLVGHWQQLLRGVVLDPHSRLSELPLLTEDERQRLLVEWNATAREYERDKCVHELFEAQAARTPDATALVFEDVRLTYAELNGRANKLAHYLRRAGVGPETIVGVCMENSPEMIVALFAVLKAGGAYVGPDPSLPAERLAYMLEDSRVRLILTQERLRERLPLDEAEVISVDEEWESIERESDENPSAVVTPDNLAYVIYTSGSTGRPKGVVGEHRQLLHYLNGILERLEMKPGASFSFTMHQTLAVDAPITFLFASLTTGGVLHLLTQQRAADPDALGRYFSEHGIDYFKVAPSHLAALQASPHPERVLPRRLLMVGGEASHWDWAERACQLAPDCVVLNHYGPTETTVGVLTYRVDERPANYHSPVLPLGRPIGDTEIYILDRHLRPVPVGVVGEIYIGGGGLSRGYLGRPDVTAERFIPDPFGSRPGARLYRTGDLARYLADGNVEFLGRIDHQVKIRAFRVELGEIETALGDHPSVQTAVVAAREVSPGDTRLAAYVVFKPGASESAEELRDFLRRTLPDYMVPSSFVMLEDLPRTPQGKVDRQRLPAPEHSRDDARAEYVAPSTPEETEVANIFSELLKVDAVGRDDDFFELGGHSLLATQLVSRLRELFRIELPLRRIFETPTVGGLAEAVVECRAQSSAEDVPQIEALPRGDRDLAELLAEMEGLSEDEVRALLDDEMQVN
ncbi:MAG TPA: amino acid adenylation domain-containing protein, partial [Pyrinomonadaceae bacterium]|nr:amino acid adenylation domain-containing protein [Pyrinomonadaceae bacterium]